jgi:EmrB/QacA subfamily drug resistance transporter
MALNQPVRPLAETLDRRGRWLLLMSLMVSLFLGALDQTVVSTAMPRILSELGGFGLLSWVFTSYMLTSTIVVPLVGKLSDMFGRKIFLLGGIFIFVAGSAACGAANSMPMLIVFRGFQGIGGGMIFASVFASVGDLFSPAERGRYMGLFTGTFSLASVLGPTLGGALTDHVGWRWVFYLNIPVALIAIPAVWKNLPARRSAQGVKIDFLGAALLSAASVALLMALVWAGDKYDWGSGEIVSLFVLAAVLTLAFVFQEMRHPSPMLPLHLFRNRVFLISNLTVFTFGIGMFGAIAYLPTFVQTAMGVSATASGVITTPQSLGVLLSSIIGGQIIARSGHYKWQTCLGAVLILGAMLFLMNIGASTKEWHLSAYMVILGLGFGLVLPSMSLVVQNAVSYQYLGVATSASQFFRQIGGVFGTAIFGAILAASYQGAFNEHVPADVPQAVPQQTLAHFEDPTLQLDQRTFALVRREFEALPDGSRLLDEVITAQKEAISIAIDNIFTAAAGVAALCLVFTLFMPELPLRKDFQEVGGPAPGQAPGAAPPGRVPGPLAVDEPAQSSTEAMRG